MGEIEHKLDQDWELRFQVGSKKSAYVVLEDGRAEFFGTELIPKKEYKFSPGTPVSIYTWEGCLIRLFGNYEEIKIDKATPMGMYLHTHACLEYMRDSADESNSNENNLGPIVMIVGPGDVGKSTLSRILVNYAVRNGRKPIFADVDVGQGNIALPGSIGAVVVDKPMPVEEQNIGSPIVYNFGYKTPTANLKLYTTLVSKLAENVHEKLPLNKKIATSGVVINTCGWVKDKGYDLLIHSAEAFEVDVIIVLDHEKLYNELMKDLPFGKVIFLPKSGGVIKRSSKVRSQQREGRILEYFYGGIVKNQPQTFDIPYDLLLIYKIEEPVPNSKSENNQIANVIPIDISSEIKHSILALSSTSNTDELATASIVGYVCIIDVDDDKKEFVVLSPFQGPIPEGLLILTNFICPTCR